MEAIKNRIGEGLGNSASRPGVSGSNFGKNQTHADSRKSSPTPSGDIFFNCCQIARLHVREQEVWDSCSRAVGDDTMCMKATTSNSIFSIFLTAIRDRMLIIRVE